MADKVKALARKTNVNKNRKRSLAAEAYDRIKQMFFNYEIVPGQKILYEDLARLLGMSITPVINALGVLEKEGLVVSKLNRGYYASEVTVEEAMNVIEARKVLEQYCVTKLIDSWSEEKGATLERLLEELSAYRPGSYTRKRLFMDARFHVGIARLAGNGIVEEMLAKLFERVYLRYRVERLPKERMEVANREHETLLDAIRRRDKEDALRALDVHFETIRGNVLGTVRSERWDEAVEDEVVEELVILRE
ncbi:MAG: GntR family transcriptional regulator [candidate division WOR-3 bacterium]